jgi:hypothetical protein
MAQCKLKYKIGERRPLTVGGSSSGADSRYAAISGPDVEMDQVLIEWTHEDGFPAGYTEHLVNIKDTSLVLSEVLARAVDNMTISQAQATEILKLAPTIVPAHPMMKDLGVIKEPGPMRKVVHDQINVRAGCPTNIIMQACEDKKEQLARALGVSLT